MSKMLPPGRFEPNKDDIAGDKISSQSRDTKDAPDFFSQPLAEQTEKLLSKMKRAKSAQDGSVYKFDLSSSNRLDPEASLQTLTRLRDGVYKELCVRLKAQGVSPSVLQPNNLAWCLPRRLDQEGLWRLLLEDPTMVPSHLVNTLITLEPSTPDSPDVSSFSTETFYYIRSFAMTVSECRLIMADIIADGFDSSKKAWHLLEEMKKRDGEAVVTLRYLGKSRDTPWKRHASDLRSTSLGGFLARFFKTVANRALPVLSNANVQTVVEAVTDSKFVPQARTDLHEKVLIALFGRGTLNIQVGGEESMRFYAEDHELFYGLRTDTIRLMQAHLRVGSQKMQEDIRQYANDVDSYVRGHATTRTGKTAFTFSDGVKAMIHEQAVPKVIRDGSALMVTVGSDIGEVSGNHAKKFYASDGPSVASVVACYNRFAHWEEGRRPSPDPNQTKRLSDEGSLPFVNCFPWFVKDDKDWPEARRLLDQYLSATSPYIVLAYGDVQYYAVTNSVNNFTKKQYKAAKRGYPDGGYSNFVGQARVSRTAVSGKEAIVIPCFHPGRSGHMGDISEKGQTIFKMVSALAWYAMSEMLRSLTVQPYWSRRTRCTEICKLVNRMLNEHTDFGKAFADAKHDYMLSIKAFQAGVLISNAAPNLPMVPRNVLAKKTILSRKGRVAAAQMPTDAVRGYEVLIECRTVQGPKNDNVRYALSWEEEDGAKWSIAPVILPEHVDASDTRDATDKRFVHFVKGGLDVRDASGQSMGSRKPIATGHSKDETVPISSIVLTMSESQDLGLFLEHWEKMTGERLAVGGCQVAYNQTEPFFPVSFFDQSRSKAAVPFSSKSLRANDYAGHLAQLKTTLPANPGDLLWLFDRFLDAHYPNGGKIDMASSSEHPNSVYRVISEFCSKALYKNHPHMTTMKALVDIAEMGQTERMIATNALTLACEVLRESFDKKKVTLSVNVDGQRKDSKRWVLEIGSSVPAETIRTWNEPVLESVVEVLEDGSEGEDSGNNEEDVSDGDSDEDEDMELVLEHEDMEL